MTGDRPKCPRCASFDAVSRPAKKHHPGKWFCDSCALIFDGSVEEWRLMSETRDRLSRDRTAPPRAFDAVEMHDGLVRDLAAAGDDLREDLEVPAPASTIFGRIAAAYAMTHEDATDDEIVDFAADCLQTFLAATGARPASTFGDWILDLDPASVSEEFLDNVATLHSFLVEMTPPSLSNVHLITSSTERTGEAPYDLETEEEDHHDRDPSPTPERSNEGRSPHLILLDGSDRDSLGFRPHDKGTAS